MNMTDLLFTPEEYANYAHEENIFRNAVMITQIENSQISQLESLQVIQPNAERAREITTRRRKLWQWALTAMRLQRQYHFPAFIYMHIAGPPGYQDLPLYRLPPNK